MSTKHKRFRFLRTLITPMLTAGFVMYFAYHMIHGAYGVKGSQFAQTRIVQLERQLSVLTEERQALTRRLALLRPPQVDLEMIEERARQSLYLVHDDEVVIFTPWLQRWRDESCCQSVP